VVGRTGSVLPAVLLHASLNTTVGTLGVLTGAADGTTPTTRPT
jgi:membrane protease YdiL (CAAX protease family)